MAVTRRVRRVLVVGRCGCWLWRGGGWGVPTRQGQLDSLKKLWDRNDLQLFTPFSEPLQSDIPTLILSGTNDPVTPPQYGEQVLRGLGAAEHLVLAGQGHGQLVVGCMPRVMAQFIDAGSTESLDAQCTKNVAPAPFMLSRAAPAP